MQNLSLENNIKNRAEAYFNKVDSDLFSKFDLEVSTLTLQFFVLISDDINGVSKVFVPTGTNERKKGIRATDLNYCIVISPASSNKESFVVHKEQIRLFVQENKDDKDAASQSLGHDYATMGYILDTKKLKEFISS